VINANNKVELKRGNDSIDMKILKQTYLNTLKEEGYENMLNQIDE
jgi:hypothetical protein